ncbi:MAG: hypothetical protein BGN86_05845 [Caulobacterales bacterium 68-7]|nr:DUF998 domain-containing protein [Caulobacterales bacterium]OJU13134.1 MAG: hypothetical protein BGN86_05845 [Caulobacterales bacterium 68-7]
MPLIMVAVVWIAQALYPGFNMGSQYISELGALKAPHPLVFNLGMMLVGVVGILAGAGFTHALEAAGGRRIVSAFAGLWVAITGLGLVFAGLFHFPDDMHRTVGIALAVQVAPIFSAWALWGVVAHRRLIWLSLGWSVLMLLVFMLMAGAWDVRTGSDVGLWQRWHGFLGALWIGIACFALERGLEDSVLDESEVEVPAH